MLLILPFGHANISAVVDVVSSRSDDVTTFCGNDSQRDIIVAEARDAVQSCCICMKRLPCSGFWALATLCFMREAFGITCSLQRLSQASALRCSLNCRLSPWYLPWIFRRLGAWSALGALGATLSPSLVSYVANYHAY